LVTLGLVLDDSGFVHRSKVFEGNVSEGKTLEVMLKGLDARTGTLVVMDVPPVECRKFQTSWTRQDVFINCKPKVHAPSVECLKSNYES